MRRAFLLLVLAVAAAAAPASPDVERWVLEHLAQAAGTDVRAALVDASDLRRITRPAASDALDIELPAEFARQRWIVVTLRWRAGGAVVATDRARVRWARLAPVWRTARDVAPGEPVLPAARTAEADLFDHPGALAAAPDPESVAARTLPEGHVLRAADLAPRVLVRRGAPVSVHYVLAGTTVRMVGTALQDGARDAVIEVLNPTSRRRVLARVTGDNTALYVQ